jgi:hypothetical protein
MRAANIAVKRQTTLIAATKHAAKLLTIVVLLVATFTVLYFAA